MSRMERRADSVAREPRDILPVVLGVLVVLAAGLMAGLQYAAPDKRVIAVIAAMLMFGIAWRIDMTSGIGLLVFALPFPRGTVFGNTNFALILLLLVIWLLRTSQRQSPALRRTPIDAPLGAFVIVWIVSFYNIQRPEILKPALLNTQLLVACILMFYLIVSNVRTERDLQRLHAFQLVSLTAVALVGVYELTTPGASLFPGWIYFPGASSAEMGLHNFRIGGPFFDYELFGEYAAVNLPLAVFAFTRARSMLLRVATGGVALLTIFILFATVTRGAMMALGAGVLYLTWIVRRRLRVVPFTIVLAALVVGFLAMDFFVANYTRSGSMLERLVGTEFKGLVPESRERAWRDGWDRFLLHPILGHGPFYAGQIGTRTYFWPHSGYLLIANLVGSVGLGFFLWLLFRLWQCTRPSVDTLDDPSYARSYLVIAHTQLIIFMADQIKIEFLRNPSYQFQVWMYFAIWVSAYFVARSLPASPSGR